MAQIPGSVRVTGIVAPTDTTDTYAVTDEIYNRGGFRTVGTIAERDQITTDRRKEGMLVNILTTGEIYTLIGGLTNSNWVVWSGGGTSTGGNTSKYTEIIGNGIDNIYVIDHNLGTIEVITQVRLISTGEVVLVDITNTTNNTVEINFALPPALNSYRVVVIG